MLIEIVISTVIALSVHTIAAFIMDLNLQKPQEKVFVMCLKLSGLVIQNAICYC